MVFYYSSDFQQSCNFQRILQQNMQELGCFMLNGVYLGAFGFLLAEPLTFSKFDIYFTPNFLTLYYTKL